MAETLPLDQIFIRKLIEIIIANLGNDSFGAKELAQESGLSLYNLKRKLLAATQKSVSQFIRETRLRKAMEMLKNEDLTASEVAYKTGFSSPNYFNTSFHEFFGYPPGKVMKGDFATGANYFSQALAIDSNLFYATIELSLVYQYQGLIDQAKKLCLKVYQKKDQMPEILKIHTNQLYAFHFETPSEQEKYLNYFWNLMIKCRLSICN